jgi:hypothetical protein
MKKTIKALALGFMLGLTACGGGGGGGDSTPVDQHIDITGHYQMTGITATTSNGYTFTERDFYPWGGWLDIGATNLSLSMMLLGDVTQGGPSPYTVAWTGYGTGVISINGSLKFTCNGSQFTLIMEGVQIDVGVTASYWIYYSKTGSPTNRAPEVALGNINVEEWLAGATHDLMNEVK